MEPINIEWEGCFSVDHVIEELNHESDSGLESDRGLYQIYGQHIIFGADSLLYIGRTRTTFSERIKFHWNDWIRYDVWPEKVYIRIARWGPTQVLQVAGADLEDAEKLEIYWHSPPHNSENIYDYTGKKPLEIVNRGERGSLVEHLSTDRLPWYPH